MVAYLFILYIENRLENFIHSWSADFVQEFLYYFNNLQHINFCSKECSNAELLQPFWIYLPHWLTTRYTSDGYEIDRKFLDEMIWAQFCLFFFFRIQDDIFDKKIKNYQLIFASNFFLMEAERILHLHFEDRDDFWKIYREAIVSSSNGMIEAAKYQKSPSTNLPNLIDAYAGIASHFNIIIAAFCVKYNRLHEFPELVKFSTEMTIAGQIMDDLADIEEDLNIGRYNYVVNLLFRNIYNINHSIKLNIQNIYKAIISSDSINLILKESEKHLLLAYETLDSIEIPEARALIQRYLRGIDKLRHEFHQKRVRTLFREIIKNK